MFGMLKNDAGASLTQPSEPAHGAKNSWTTPAFKFWNIVIWLRQTLILDVMKRTLYM
jgi:hypothetical protein